MLCLKYEFNFIPFCKVQEPPSWVLKPSDVQGIETEKAEFKCQALGSPHPSYTWVDREGIDATDKEGMTIINLFNQTIKAYLSRMEIRSKHWNPNCISAGKKRCRAVYMYC